MILAWLSMMLVATPGLAGSIWQSEVLQDGAWTDLSGRAWTAEDLEGKVVLLDFWATWCAPCLAEMPNLRRLDERFSSDDLIIVGIALDSMDRRGLQSFILRHGISWPQIHQRRGVESALARRFEVEAVPVTLLVDRQGRIVARDLRGKALEAVIGTLVGGAEEMDARHDSRGLIAFRSF